MPFSDVSVTSVDTAAVATRLGVEVTIFDATLQRFRTWIYLHNGHASTAFAAGELASHNTTTNTIHGNVERSVVVGGPAAINSERIVGVAQHAVANDAGAWFGRKGQFEVSHAGGGVQGRSIAPSAAVGVADDVAASVPAIGYSIDDTSGAAGNYTCYINCRG